MEWLIGWMHERMIDHDEAQVLNLCAIAQHKLVLLHVCQAPPEQLYGGVVLGYHALPLRDLFAQGCNVDLEVLALALKRKHLKP